MERITRADLRQMRLEWLEKQKRHLIEIIVRNIKETAREGKLNYMHFHNKDLQGWLISPMELVGRLREVLVDLDIEYADPHITIRWN